MSKIIKWGIIGLGNAASNLANQFKFVSNSSLIAVASKTKEKRALFQNKYSIQSKNVYDNYEDLLLNKDVDLVYIALPHSMHKEWCIKAAEKNKNILVEKPAATSVSDLEKILKVVKKNNIFFAEGLSYEFHPFYLKIISVLKQIKLNDVLSIDSSLGNDAIGGRFFFGIRLKSPKSHKRLFNPSLAGGAIWDVGCYPVSIVQKIISVLNNNKSIKPEVVESFKKIGKTKVDEFSFINLKYNHIFSNIEVSISKNLLNNVVINLKNGKIIISNPWLHLDNDSSIQVIKNNKIENFIYKNIHNVYRQEIKTVSKFLINNKKEFTPPLSLCTDIRDRIAIMEQWVSK